MVLVWMADGLHKGFAAADLAEAGQARGETPEAGDGPAGALSASWDAAAAAAIERPYLDREMGAVKRRAHLDLIERWLGDLRGKAVLKTDLWEEGVAGDELLLTLGARAGSATGIDLSPTVVAAATDAAGRAGVSPRLFVADARALPLRAGSVDVVISTSTIDHLGDHDRLLSLREIHRVLVPGGTLLVTVDNADNIGDPLLQFARRRGLVPFPLTASLTQDDLRQLLTETGFRLGPTAFLVHGPRVVTTLLVRAARLLPQSLSNVAVPALLRMLEAVGRRQPRRMGAFVAIRATRAE
jgi:SAM-dependent methyltransferase